MSGDALKLALELQAAGVAQTASILDSLYRGAEAERRALRDGVRWALSLAVFGGTTAEYERVLRAAQWVLEPSDDVLDYYRATVERNEYPYEPWVGYRIAGGAP